MSEPASPPGRRVVLLLGGSAGYAAAVAVVALDSTGRHEWWALPIWLLAIACFAAAFRERRDGRLVAAGERIDLAAVVAVALAARLLFLRDYPFPNHPDALRDGAVFAARLAGLSPHGIPSPFGWGSFEAHSLLVVVPVVPLFQVFGRDVLVFRSVAAVTSTLAVALTWLVARASFGRVAAFWSAVFLAVGPHALFFGRQFVVGSWSMLWTVAVLGSLARFFRERTRGALATAGLVLGAAACFHAAVRTLVFLGAMLVVGDSAVEAVRGGRRRAAAGMLAVFVAMLLVGFGPMVLVTPPRILFHVARLPWLGAVGENLDPGSLMRALGRASSLWVDGLRLYALDPVAGFFIGHDAPMLGPLEAGLFVIGAATALRLRAPLARLLLLTVMVVPFTNFVLTGGQNLDSRLTPLYPTTALLAGLGMSTLLRFVPGATARIALGLAVGAVVAIGTSRLFDGRMSAFRGSALHAFLVRHAAERMRDVERGNAPVAFCVAGSERTNRELELKHHREAFEFFVEAPVHRLPRAVTTEDGELTIVRLERSCSDAPSGSVSEIRPCADASGFRCPPSANGIVLREIVRCPVADASAASCEGGWTK